MPALRLALVVLLFAVSVAAAPFGDEPFEHGLILAAANSGGSGGTFWRTDVWIHNPGFDEAKVGFFLLPNGRSGKNDELAGEVLVQPGETLELHNLLGSVLGTEVVVAAVEFRVIDGPAVFVQSRTYTGDSRSPLLPAAGAMDAATTDDPIEIEDMATLKAFRTNLSLVNPGDDPELVEVLIHDDEGVIVKSLQLEIGPRSYRSIPNLLGDLEVRIRAGHLTIHPLGAGEIHALATVVAADSGSVRVPATRTQSRVALDAEER